MKFIKRATVAFTGAMLLTTWIVCCVALGTLIGNIETYSIERSADAAAMEQFRKSLNDLAPDRLPSLPGDTDRPGHEQPDDSHGEAL